MLLSCQHPVTILFNSAGMLFHVFQLFLLIYVSRPLEALAPTSVQPSLSEHVAPTSVALIFRVMFVDLLKSLLLT